MNSKDVSKLVSTIVDRVLASAPAAGGVAIGSDHGGFPLKEDLKSFLQKAGHEVTDVGTHSTDAVDYPDYAVEVGREVASGRCRFGVMVDGAGIGSAMAANKVPGVRAALCYDLSTANNAREHNDANVLTLGAGLIGPALARQIVARFLEVECTAERHQRRVAKINALDGGERSTAPRPVVSEEALIP